MSHPLVRPWAFVLFASSLIAQTPAPSTAPATERPGPPARAPINDAYYRLGPDSQSMEGVPKGRFVGPFTLPSEVFPGTQHTYTVYVPAQYNPAEPAALIVLNDGHAMMAEPGDVQAHHVLDNLIHRREIPVMIAVFINPGRRPDQPEPSRSDWGDRTTNRAEEYNHPDDRYARVIVDELLPALEKDYNLSKNPDHRAMMGTSSGAIAAFTTAWFRPDHFRKVISFVGSYTDIRGGHVIPDLVAQSERKPLRIFLQGGRNDNRHLTNPKRDWFLNNVRLKDALTAKGYDLAYTWGIGNHGQKQGGAIFPEAMRWLWRDQPVSTDPYDAVERSPRPASTPPVNP